MRRRTSRATGITAFGVCLALLAACEQPAERDTDGGNGGEGYSPNSISIATGTTSGVYYPIGGVMAEIVGENVEDMNASAESTAASVENLRLLDAGDSDVAITQGDVAFQALNAEGQFDEPIETRTLMVLYPNVYHAVSLQSVHQQLGLDCFSDVAGNRFSVGAAGSGNELSTNLVLDTLGLSPADDISRQRLAYAETAEALRENQLDAGSWVVGEGHATLNELAATDPLHLIEMCPDERERILDAYPEVYTEHTIEADTYPTLDEDTETIALWNVVSVSPDLSEDSAYELARAFYENVESINQVYEPGAEYLTLDTLQNSPAPLHPGVVRYAEEQGVEIPDELRG